MHANKKTSVFLQIFFYLHLIFTQAFIFSFPVYAEKTHNVPPPSGTGVMINNQQQKLSSDDRDEDKSIATFLSGAGSLFSQENKTDAVANALINSAAGKSSNEIQQWLQQYGNAQVSLGLDRDFSLESANLDWLIPLYNKNENLIFTQLGARRVDDRNIMNLGLGYRYFTDSWMWGVNAFYDQQLSDNTHQRLGLGGELGWDYFKLSANEYQRLSGWKNSTEHQDYEERVANGYDIRAEGYLPALPQLGAQVMWEQYYGRDVALFGDDDDERQRDPYAVTVGINYTPFPLVTLGVNQKMGKGDQNDTQVALNFNWMPGVPLSEQLDSDKVKDRRTLRGSRLDLVSRNNNIVLEYRKKEVISLELPSRIEGIESKTIPVAVNISTKHPLDHIVWQDEQLVNHGGKITEKNGSWSVVLPHYQQNSKNDNSYDVSATAWDNQGNKSATAHMTVAVTGFDVKTVSTHTTVAKTSLPADGVSSAEVTLTVSSNSGQRITGLASDLSTTLIRAANLKNTSAETPSREKISAYKEQSPGVYVSTFTSGTTAGKVVIQPEYKSTPLGTTSIELEVIDSQLRFTQLDTDKSTALANSKDAIVLKAKVANAVGEPVAGVKVQWQADSALVNLSASQSTTDAQGYASVSATSSQVLDTAVSAQLENGQSIKSRPLQFIADADSASVTHLDADKARAKANGQDAITLRALVMDSNQHPLANQTVRWSINSKDNAGHLADKQSSTNEQGMATIGVTSAKVGQAMVSAVTGNSKPVESEMLSFLADSDSATLGKITTNKTNALANGQDTVTLSVMVEDDNKNPVKGVTVGWTTASKTANLSAAATETSEQGLASINVSSSTVEDLQVVATMAAQSQTSSTLHFTADSGSARVKTLNADKMKATANNNDRVVLTAQVVDLNNHPVSAAPLHWTIVQGQGTLSESQGVTNEQGEGSIMLTSEHEGSVVVAVKSTAGDAVNSPELVFAADAATAKVTLVTVNKSQASADGKDKVTYTATVTDVNGNPLDGETVNWTATPSTAALSSATSRTDAGGTAAVSVSTLTAGEVHVTAQAGSGAAWNVPVVTFNADSSTAQLGNLVASKQAALADGSDSITFTGVIADKNGNPLANINVAWSVTPTTGQLSSTSGSSDSKGKVAVTLKSSQVATYQVKATVNGSDETSEPVSFTADKTTAAIQTLSATKTSDISANEVVTFTAEVKDLEGHPVKGMTIAWSGDNSAGEFDKPTSESDADGKASVIWRSTLAKLTTITAKMTNNSQKTLQVEVVPDLKSARPVSVNADKDNATANGQDLISLTAMVKDQYGNAVNKAKVGWQVAPAAHYTLSEAESLTDASGESKVTLASSDVVACKATASFNNVSKSSQMLRYVADSATETLSSLVANNTTNVVAGKDTILLKATVIDANNHPVSNATVYWGSDNESGTFQQGESSLTDSLGVAEISYTATTAKPTVVGAGINHSRQTLTVSYIGNVETAHLSEIKSDKVKAVADGAERVTWSVNVKDANGNILPEGIVHWSSNDPALTFTSASSVSDAKGVATMSGYTKKAGDVIVTASLTTPAQSLSAEKVTFIGDVKTAKLVSLKTNKKIVLSNGSDSVKYDVVVQDANDNLVPDAPVNWQTSMNELSSAISKTDNTGVATVALSGHQMGLVTVSASINNTTLSDKNVKFINTIEDTWVINTDNSNYSSAEIKGYSSLGFVTTAPTDGPTSLEWAPKGYAAVSTPVTLISDSGQQFTVKLKGYRQSDCSTRPLNAAVSCQAIESGMRAQFSYERTENTDLPVGHYTGLVHFFGKDWATSYAFEYKLTLDLTVH